MYDLTVRSEEQEFPQCTGLFTMCTSGSFTNFWISLRQTLKGNVHFFGVIEGTVILGFMETFMDIMSNNTVKENLFNNL